MSKFDVAEYLKGLSKEELLAIMLSDWNFLQKSKRLIDFSIWQYRSKEIREKMQVHLANDNSVELAREIDILAKKFNESKSISEKQDFLKQREKLFNKIRKIQKEYAELRKQEERTDQFYEQNLKPCD